MPAGGRWGIRALGHELARDRRGREAHAAELLKVFEKAHGADPDLLLVAVPTGLGTRCMNAIRHILDGNEESCGEQIRPRRTWRSNQVFRLPGGTEDNDLWVHNDGEHLTSTFVPTDERREAIANGANLDLTIWGQGQPPVAITLSHAPVGKRPEPGEEGASA